jgi:hypothetical protein
VLYANTNRLPYFVQLIPQDSPPSSKAKIKNMLLRGRNLLIFAVIYVLILLIVFGRGRREGPSGFTILVIVVFGAALVYGVALRHASRKNVGTVQQIAPLSPEDALQQVLRGAFGEDHSLQDGTPYKLFRHPIVDHHGFPCTPGLWGTVEALNLQTGKIAWEQAHGSQVPGKQTGSLSLGGLIVTAGGLVFSAGTREPLLRAYDATTGGELWKGDLPVPAQATPMTYQVKGRQFVVIAAGGSGLWGTQQGDSVVAFGLK